jgi:hypothetical protein
MNAVTQVARVLSRQPAPSARIRQGVVTAINGDGTVNLTLGGVALSNVKALKGSSPTVSGAVLLVVCGRDMFVLGAVATSSAQL